MTQHFLNFFARKLALRLSLPPAPPQCLLVPRVGLLGTGQAPGLSASPAAAAFRASLGDAPFTAAGKYFHQEDSWCSVPPASLLTSWDIL